VRVGLLRLRAPADRTAPLGCSVNLNWPPRAAVHHLQRVLGVSERSRHHGPDLGKSVVRQFNPRAVALDRLKQRGQMRAAYGLSVATGFQFSAKSQVSEVPWLRTPGRRLAGGARALVAPMPRCQ
jgi:hypothetical protein